MSPSIAHNDAEECTTLTKSPYIFQLFQYYGHHHLSPMYQMLCPHGQCGRTQPINWPPDNENAFSAMPRDEGARACTGLVNKPPSSCTGTPKILLKPSSALAIEHLRSVLMIHPPSHAGTPLDA